jgi:hypothetical protein
MNESALDFVSVHQTSFLITGAFVDVSHGK